MGDEKGDFQAEVQRLDRQLRMLKMVLAVLIGLWLGSMLMTQSLLTRTVWQGREFVVVDEDGTRRAALGMSDDGARLELRDGEGRARARLAVAADGTADIRFLDEHRGHRMALGLDAAGRPTVTGVGDLHPVEERGH